MSYGGPIPPSPVHLHIMTYLIEFTIVTTSLNQIMIITELLIHYSDAFQLSLSGLVQSSSFYADIYIYICVFMLF